MLQTANISGLSIVTGNIDLGILNNSLNPLASRWVLYV